MSVVSSLLNKAARQTGQYFSRQVNNAFRQVSQRLLEIAQPQRRVALAWADDAALPTLQRWRLGQQNRPFVLRMNNAQASNTSLTGTTGGSSGSKLPNDVEFDFGFLKNPWFWVINGGIVTVAAWPHIKKFFGGQ